MKSSLSVLLCLLLASQADLLTGTSTVVSSINVAAFSVAPGLTTSVNATLTKGLVTTEADSYIASISVTNTGNITGYYELYYQTLTNVRYAAGFSSAFTGLLSATLSYGYFAKTNMTAGSFSATLTITPPTVSVAVNYQLFLLSNGSTSGLFNSGSSQGALSYTSTGTTQTFALPSVQTASLLYSSYSPSTVSINPFPALYDLLSTAAAGINTTFQYGSDSAQSLFLTIRSDTAATVKTTFSKVVAVSNAAAVVFNDASGKAYTDIKAFYSFGITNAQNVKGQLTFAFNKTVVDAQKTTADTLRWVSITADGTATILETRLENTTDTAGNILYRISSSLSASADASVQYAVYVEQKIQNGTLSTVKQTLYGGASINQTFLLARVFVASLSTTTTAQISLLTPAGFSVTLFINNTGSVSGYFNLYSTFFAGINYPNGISGSLYGNGQFDTSYGFLLQSDIQNEFFANITITRPTVSVALNSKLSLFYVLNGTDGFATSATANYQYGLLAAVPGATTSITTYSLLSVPSAYYLLGSISLQTPPVIPAIYNVQAAVFAKVNATYNFAQGLAVTVYNEADGRLRVTYATTVQTANNAAVVIKNAGNKTFTAANVYVKVIVDNATALTGQLSFTLDAATAAAFKTNISALVWVHISADGSATVLQSSSSSNSDGTGTVTTNGNPSNDNGSSNGSPSPSLNNNADETYALYISGQSSTTTTTSNGSGNGSVTGSGALATVSALLVAVAAVASL